MKYEKPSITMSFPAITAVQGACEKGGRQADTAGPGCGSGIHSVVSAYEADE